MKGDLTILIKNEYVLMTYYAETLISEISMAVYGKIS